MAVLGPTASGKTALALELARRFQGEIINCDSVAMYRDFEIGTAKPSPAERAEVPHHLLDYADPLVDISAGEYARHARQIVQEVAERKHLPIVSGGTGLYLRALLEGLFTGPQRSEELRDRLRQRVADRGQDIFIAFYGSSTRRRPSVFMPTIFPRLFGRSRCALPRGSR